MFNDQLGIALGIYPGGIDSFEIFFGDPTGLSAGPSNKNGHFVIHGKLKQLLKGRQSDRHNAVADGGLH